MIIWEWGSSTMSFDLSENKSQLQTWTRIQIFYKRPKSSPTTIYIKIDCK